MGKFPDQPDEITAAQRKLCMQIGAYALYLMQTPPAEDPDTWHDDETTGRFIEDLPEEVQDDFENVIVHVLHPRLKEEHEPARLWAKLGVRLKNAYQVYKGKISLDDALMLVAIPARSAFATAVKLMQNGDRRLIYEAQLDSFMSKSEADYAQGELNRLMEGPQNDPSKK